MSSKQRRHLWILTCAVLVIAFAWANLNGLGQAWATHYDWRCAECRVMLYRCPMKRITYLEVPASYQVHPHGWRLENQPTRWSPWKPWQWLVWATVDSDVLKAPRPVDLFPTARINWRSEEEGLQKLARDPGYLLAQELSAPTEQPTSAPE